MQTSKQQAAGGAYQWKRGRFDTFYAKMQIRIGGKEEITLAKGDAFEYDGQIIRYMGMEISNIHLRTSIEKGWVTSDPDGVDTGVTAVRPVRDRAASKSVNRDLSRVQRIKGADMATDHMDEETVMEVSDRRAQGTGTRVMNVPSDRAQPRVMTAGDNRRVAGGMEVDSSDVEEQDGVVVGRVRTPAKLKATMDSREGRSASQLEDRNRAAHYSGGAGYIREEVREGVTIKTNVKQMKRGVVAGDESDGTRVGTVRGVDQRGRAAHAAPGKAAHPKKPVKAAPVKKAPAPVKKAPAPVKKAPVKKAPAAAKPSVKIDTSLDPRIRMARRFDPKFPPGWLFSGKLKDRLDAVKKHGATEQFLEALYAAEGDQMRALLKREFPGQFGT